MRLHSNSSNNEEKLRYNTFDLKCGVSFDVVKPLQDSDKCE